MRPFHGILITLAFLVPTVSSAQALPEPGERVRVTRIGGGTVAGELTRSSNDSLWVTDAMETVHAMPITAVERLQRSLGHHGEFARNFIMIAGGATLGGGVIGAVAYSPCRSTELLGCLLHPESRTEAFALGMVFGALIGVPAGLITGVSRRYERWTEVDLGGNEPGSFTVRPLLGPRPGLVVSLRPGGP